MTHLVDGDGQQVSERKKGKQINKIPQMFVIHYMCIFIKIKELPSTFMGLIYFLSTDWNGHFV
jgi:hypothetical protein